LEQVELVELPPEVEVLLVVHLHLIHLLLTAVVMAEHFQAVNMTAVMAHQVVAL